MALVNIDPDEDLIHVPPPGDWTYVRVNRSGPEDFHAWANGDEATGEVRLWDGRIPLRRPLPGPLYMCFSDANTAFAFKMKFDLTIVEE